METTEEVMSPSVRSCAAWWKLKSQEGGIYASQRAAKRTVPHCEDKGCQTDPVVILDASATGQADNLRGVTATAEQKADHVVRAGKFVAGALAGLSQAEDVSKLWGAGDEEEPSVSRYPLPAWRRRQQSRSKSTNGHPSRQSNGRPAGNVGYNGVRRDLGNVADANFDLRGWANYSLSNGFPASPMEASRDQGTDGEWGVLTPTRRGTIGQRPDDPLLKQLLSTVTLAYMLLQGDTINGPLLLRGPWLGSDLGGDGPGPAWPAGSPYFGEKNERGLGGSLRSVPDASRASGRGMPPGLCLGQEASGAGSLGFSQRLGLSGVFVESPARVGEGDDAGAMMLVSEEGQGRGRGRGRGRGFTSLL
eukprot:jgi/Mesvir1/3528/Mv12001-RA.1